MRKAEAHRHTDHLRPWLPGIAITPGIYLEALLLASLSTFLVVVVGAQLHNFKNSSLPG